MRVRVTVNGSGTVGKGVAGATQPDRELVGVAKTDPALGLVPA